VAFPSQHRLVFLRETGAGDATVRRERRVLLMVGVGVSALLALALVPARAAVFGVSADAYPNIAGGVVLASGWLGVTRGGLAGSGRLRAAAAKLVMEQVARVAAGLDIVLVGSGIIAYRWTLVAPLLLVAGCRVRPTLQDANWAPGGLRQDAPLSEVDRRGVAKINPLVV
jgi:hypothetical protein